MSQQLQFTPGGPSFWAGLVEFAVVDTTSGQVLVQQANRDESEAVPFTGAPSPADPITRLTNAGLVQLVGNPIAFINPTTVAEYQVQGTTAVTVTFLSGRSQAFTYAAMVNFLAWTPPTVAGVFEPGTGASSVQQSGVSANAAGIESFAFGLNAQALNDYAIAFGTSSVAESFAIAIGASAQANGFYGMAIGQNAQTPAFGGMAIGQGAVGLNDYSVAIGWNAQANGSSAVVIGDSAVGAGEAVIIGGLAEGGLFFPAIAIGHSAESKGNYSIAMGNSALSNFENSIAIGFNAYATDDFGIAIGRAAQAGSYANALGYFAQATAPISLALGYTATTTGTGASIALMGSATQVQAVAIGASTNANHANAVVFQARTSSRNDCMFIRHLDILDRFDIHLGTTNGTRLGTFQEQKLGFWGATPIVRPNVSTAGTVQDQISAIRAALNNMGLINLI